MLWLISHSLILRINWELVISIYVISVSEVLKMNELSYKCLLWPCVSTSCRVAGDPSESTPVSPNGGQEWAPLRSPLRSPLKRQSSVHSARLGSTKSLSAAVFADRLPPPTGVQFSGDVSRSDENVLDSPRQRRSYGSFPFTPSADSSTFHQYRSMDSSMSVADSEAYFSAAEEFEPISSDEGPGTYPGRKRKRRQQIGYSRSSIYHSVEGPLAYMLNGEMIMEPRPLPIPSLASQASFVSALGIEEEGSIEVEKTPEPGLVTSKPHIMACYQSYLAHYQVSNWSVKQPTNKRTSKSSLHRPLDLDTPTSEESSASFDQLSIPVFKVNLVFMNFKFASDTLSVFTLLYRSSYSLCRSSDLASLPVPCWTEVSS